MAYATEQTLFVPVLVRGKLHKVSVFDFLATSFTDFLRLFAFDRPNDVCKEKINESMVIALF